MDAAALGGVHSHGTTNVDVNHRPRSLARIGPRVLAPARWSTSLP
jgi:hypothetical protein